MKSERLDFLWQYIPAYRRIFGKDVLRGHEICGLGAEVRLLLAISAVKEEQKTVLYVTENEDDAKKIRSAAHRFLSREETGFYPARDLLPCESMAVNDGQRIDRIQVLKGLLSPQPFLAVISRNTLSRRVLPPALWRNAEKTLKVGDIIEIRDLTDRLVEIGYTRETLTEDPGTFSVRGSIVDVFPVGSLYPFRIDFFDDEIESIRTFDRETQISLETVDSMTVSPGAPFFLPVSGRDKGIAELQASADAMAANLKGEKKHRFRERTARLLEYLAEGILPDVTEQMLPYFCEEAYIEDYLPPEGLIIIDEPGNIRRGLEEDDQLLKDVCGELYPEGDILPRYADIFRNAEAVFAALNCRKLLAFSFLRAPHGLDTEIIEDVALRDFSFYRTKEERGEELGELSAKGDVWFCAPDENGVKRCEGLIRSLDLKNCFVVIFPLEHSLEAYRAGAWFIAEKGLTGYEQKNPAQRKKKKGKPIASFVDLKIGDYIVHDVHGIGRYLGIERLTVEGIDRDYLLIAYDGTDKLYVPTDQMDLIQKYIGNGDTAPKINKLGGKDWIHTKEKVRGSVREMAEELIRLYAEREREKGFAFPQDSEWQQEMEGEFPFEETPDQLDAITDVKADMEKERPMDRLLCGDVGYGKTEVALRAAFKAVLGGKQVAVLVPTTVLAQQHERTFRERLEKFGVRIGGLSRFKTQKEINAVIDRLSAGEVDIVIGTHMLFNKRVHFQNLGLLVIDEEQRFGVAHKEKIKALKKNVDVLTMSATPIPRTLHMSLVGVRDISIIETPPRFRLPIKTYVLEYQRRLVQEAIERELARGGQVYYIHNRVDDLDAVAASLREMVPEASLLIGHGQMNESQLEQVMMEFMQREADILLCTTIVESGLDIPNVNTLIVDGADRFGLSQMYQLRGRVGRSRRQAFAYFLYPRGKLLNTGAQKRLAAIRDYTDLGSGFKIAMRDMEIRGAGNILGAEQSGHMVSVGFDMYCRLIEEEVRRLNGEEVKPKQEDITIDILCAAYLPDEYVGDREIKNGIYKRLAEISSGKELKAYLDELEDRFGSVPDPVYHLVLVIRLKLLAKKLEITDITQKRGYFDIKFRGLNSVGGEAIGSLFKEFGRIFEFTMGDRLGMKVRTGKFDGTKALQLIIKVLTFLVKNEASKE